MNPEFDFDFIVEGDDLPAVPAEFGGPQPEINLQSGTSVIDDNQIRIRLPQCGHNFHMNCIMDWIISKIKKNMQPGCPSCREPFNL